ncbi:MAG: hypothetical protein M0030_13060 [Actinomycetota bacterium]|nr:hypothetical protein [Actinomycetota bacterium]
MSLTLFAARDLGHSSLNLELSCTPVQPGSGQINVVLSGHGVVDVG